MSAKRAKKERTTGRAIRSSRRAVSPSPSPLASCANVLDFEAIARGRMEPAFYDYYAGGAEDEITLAANRRAFAEVFLRPRVLVDVSRIETATTLLGTSVSMPVLIAPTAFHRLAHPDGELATAALAPAASTTSSHRARSARPPSLKSRFRRSGWRGCRGRGTPFRTDCG